MDYSPWGHKESDTTERLSLPFCLECEKALEIDTGDGLIPVLLFQSFKCSPQCSFMDVRVSYTFLFNCVCVCLCVLIYK